MSPAAGQSAETPEMGQQTSQTTKGIINFHFSKVNLIVVNREIEYNPNSRRPHFVVNRTLLRSKNAEWGLTAGPWTKSQNGRQPSAGERCVYIQAQY